MEDVRGGDEAQDVLALGLAQVQRHGPLVAGDDLPPQAVPVAAVFAFLADFENIPA
jgi:hypothetical protein